LEKEIVINGFAQYSLVRIVIVFPCNVTTCGSLFDVFGFGNFVVFVGPVFFVFIE